MNGRTLRAPTGLAGAPLPMPGLFGPSNPLQADWTGRRVWLVGASTGIGEALARALHARGAQVAVSARNARALEAFVSTHAGSVALPLDAQDPAALREAARSWSQGGPIDLVAYCAGHYRPMRAETWSLEEMLQHQQVNYVGALNLLDAVLPLLRAQGRGHVSLFGSVAGYRGLPRSLAYGPTKAALIHLAEALYLDLRPQGVGVSIVNPGFVRTPLTAQNDFHMPALMSPDEAARAILRGWARGRFEIHFPRRFTLGMKLLRLLPFRAYQLAVRRFTGA